MKPSRKIAIALLIVLGLSILLARTDLWLVRVNADELTAEPTAGMNTFADFQSESWVNLPITVPPDFIGNLVNQNTPARLKDRRRDDFTNLLANDWVDYDIKRGDFSFQPKNGRLHFKVPLSGRLTAGGKFIGLPVQQSCHFSGTISGSVLPALDSDWTLSPDLQIAVDITRAEMCVFRAVRISVVGKMREALRRSVPDVEKDFNRQLAKSLDLKQKAATAWSALHVKRRVLESPESWLLVKPVEVSFQKVTISDTGSISTGLGVRCRLVGNIGSEPDSPALAPLPPLTVVQEIPTGFRLALPLRIDPASINEALRKSFSAREVDAGGHRIRFLNPEIRIAHERLFIQTDFEAKSGWLAKRIKGRVILEGVPVLHAKTNTLVVKDLGYSVKSREALATSAAWMLQPVVLGELKVRATYNYGKDLEEASSKANRTASEMGQASQNGLDVVISSLEADALSLSQGHIFLECAASGGATMIVK